MDTDLCNTLTPPEGLQDWFTDLDSWVCRFNASFSLSRTQPKRQDSNPNDTCNCNKEANENKHENTQPSSKNSIVKTQPSSENSTLHEFIVNGILIKHKRRERNIYKTDILDIFKVNDDFTYYDHVLFTTVIENGRKQVYKYMWRSKM